MRTIDADELKALYEDLDDDLRLSVRVAKANIDDMPTVEAEPKYGRWLIGVGENGEPIGTYCSECGWSWERNIAAIQLNKVFSRIETPRCPYCGAKMDLTE